MTDFESSLNTVKYTMLIALERHTQQLGLGDESYTDIIIAQVKGSLSTLQLLVNNLPISNDLKDQFNEYQRDLSDLFQAGAHEQFTSSVINKQAENLEKRFKIIL